MAAHRHYRPNHIALRRLLERERELGGAWRLKIAAKIVISRIPFSTKLRHRLGVFRHGYMNQLDYASGVLEKHLQAAGIEGKVAGWKILELGPGDGVLTALLVASRGASATLVDVGEFASRDVEDYKQLALNMRKKGWSCPDFSGAREIAEMLRVCSADYLTNGLKSVRGITGESIDFAFSHAVLEHIRRREFRALMAELFRVLRRGAFCSHVVDLADHLGGALNNLRFSEHVWESDFMVNSGFYTNRIRCNEMLQQMQDAGFQIETVTKNYWPELPTHPNSMSAQFRHMESEELRIRGFHVVCKKT
ncbi:MAG: class I SAM-dependent methyltransferase [Rhizomicrobium sp.]